MKEYKVGLIRHRCSNLMRLGKLVKLFRYTPERKKCPNCGKLRPIRVLVPPKKKSRVLITESK